MNSIDENEYFVIKGRITNDKDKPLDDLLIQAWHANYGKKTYNHPFSFQGLPVTTNPTGEFELILLKSSTIKRFKKNNNQVMLCFKVFNGRLVDERIYQMANPKKPLLDTSKKPRIIWTPDDNGPVNLVIKGYDPSPGDERLIDAWAAFRNFSVNITEELKDAFETASFDTLENVLSEVAQENNLNPERILHIFVRNLLEEFQQDSSIIEKDPKELSNEIRQKVVSSYLPQSEAQETQGPPETLVSFTDVEFLELFNANMNQEKFGEAIGTVSSQTLIIASTRISDHRPLTYSEISSIINRLVDEKKITDIRFEPRSNDPLDLLWIRISPPIDNIIIEAPDSQLDEDSKELQNEELEGSFPTPQPPKIDPKQSLTEQWGEFIRNDHFLLKKPKKLAELIELLQGIEDLSLTVNSKDNSMLLLLNDVYWHIYVDDPKFREKLVRENKATVNYEEFLQQAEDILRKYDKIITSDPSLSTIPTDVLGLLTKEYFENQLQEYSMDNCNSSFPELYLDELELGDITENYYLDVIERFWKHEESVPEFLQNYSSDSPNKLSILHLRRILNRTMNQKLLQNISQISNKYVKLGPLEIINIYGCKTNDRLQAKLFIAEHSEYKVSIDEILEILHLFREVKLSNEFNAMRFDVITAADIQIIIDYFEDDDPVIRHLAETYNLTIDQISEIYLQSKEIWSHFSKHNPKVRHVEVIE